MLWDTLAAPWRCCLEEAWAAYRAGSLPIGAAVTDAAGNIVARGRNRIFERQAEGQVLRGHRLAHAEMNALVALDWTAVEPRDCAIYTTTEPCPLCAGAIRMTGLSAIHYAARDAAAGSVALFAATPFMRRRAVAIAGPECADLEAVVVAMHVEWSLADAAAMTEPRSAERAAFLLESWSPVTPRGVALGHALHASGLLRRLRADGAPASAAIDHLAAALARLDAARDG